MEADEWREQAPAVIAPIIIKEAPKAPLMLPYLTLSSTEAQ